MYKVLLVAVLILAGCKTTEQILPLGSVVTLKEFGTKGILTYCNTNLRGCTVRLESGETTTWYDFEIVEKVFRVTE